MTDTTTTRNVQGAVNLADALIQTVAQEDDTLERLGRLFDDQLEALRKQDMQVLEQATVESHELLAGLDRLRQTRVRQTRLLGRVLDVESDASLSALADALEKGARGVESAARLREVREHVRTRAQNTWRRCEELEYTLRYAADLGREMLSVIQDLNVPAPTRVYTAKGSTADGTSNRSFVNELG